MEKKWSIECFDYLGKKPALFVNNHRRYETIIGSLITITISFGLLAVILYFFVEFFSGIGMTMIYSKGTVNELLSYNWNQRIFMLQYSFSNGTKIDPRISSIQVVHFNYQKNNVNRTFIPIERCAFDRHFSKKENEELLKKYSINNFYCLSPKYNQLLSEDTLTLTSNYLNIFAHSCMNTTENNNHCFPSETIGSIMRSSAIYLSFVYEDTHIDHFNTTNPFQKNIYNINKLISWSMNYDYTLYWKKVSYKSDKGFFFSQWKTFEDYQYDIYSEEVLFDSNPERYLIPNSFAQIKIAIFPKGIENYQRNFPKIQEIIANVSGIMTVVIHLSQLLVNMLTSGIYYTQLFNDSRRESYLMKSSCQLTRIKTKSLTQLLPSFNKTARVSNLTSFQWKILPSFNTKTKYLTKCKMEIAKILSIENIISKMISIESQLKNNFQTLLANSSFQETKRNLKNKSICNNFMTPYSSFISLKKEEIEA